VRTLEEVTISGAAATYYLTLTMNPTGLQYLSVSGSGALQNYVTNGFTAVLSDISQNFVLAGTQPGDILNLTGPGGNPNLGEYVVLATNTQDPTNLTVNQIAIIGRFISTGTGFSYTLNNPISPALGFTATAHAKTFTRVANKIYLGRCVFDGTNVTSLTHLCEPWRLCRVYERVSEWRQL